LDSGGTDLLLEGAVTDHSKLPFLQGVQEHLFIALDGDVLRYPAKVVVHFLGQVPPDV